jgi:hypothetical protein
VRYQFVRPTYKLVFDLEREQDFLPDEDVLIDESSIAAEPPTERNPETSEYWANEMNEITEITRVVR